MKQSWFLCIDLKSFYASVECAERNLDPFKTNLVVADPERSRGTICLAITPAMKQLGVKNRCRIFQIPKQIKYIVAPPRMQLYIDYSAQIYSIYLHYVAKEDIHVYSIDEVFLDITDYLPLYHMTPRELGKQIMDEIFHETKIRATCGIGTNLYLAKVALDITAKHTSDFIGELTEETFCQKLWHHKPLTDFWRIGPGIANRLATYGIFCMEDIAHGNEDLLYKVFGVDAELLIDHAWGRETTTMEDIKNYHSDNHCLSSGQVLPRDYSFEETRLIIKEMTDLLCLDLVDKGLITNSITLYLGYARLSQTTFVNGTIQLPTDTNSDRLMIPAVLELYDRIADPACSIRRINLNCNQIHPEEYHQYDFFLDNELLIKDRKIQEASLEIKKRYGKNAILKGMNLEKGGTTIERNRQIGGHKSGIEQT